MATILLSAVGASVGAGFGGAMLGLSGAVIGRAVGATFGRMIDQRLLGAGSKAVETGRIDRLRIPTTGEGVPIPRIWGQMRVPGHIIWATPLEEVSESSGGGKGTAPKVTEISYRMSVAIALCEGAILGVGRVWADGEEISPDDLNMRVYQGGENQLPDPCIQAHEGDAAPAYRGTAYVVMEDLSLERWGNRLPQFGFEVTRATAHGHGLARDVAAVAMIPGTGEYSLATTAVNYEIDESESYAANRATPLAPTDFSASMDILGRELPNVGSVSLVVSWFGDDLRVGHCSLRPKVESKGHDGAQMPWRAGGIDRAAAQEVTRIDDRPIYGGTPADASVIEALSAIQASGRKAVFYPFILMEQIAGNGRPDPWSDADEQPVMPWRGRITSEIAPGRDGSPDGSAAAVDAVAAFFGQAQPGDFAIEDGRVVYSGPDEWSYRRFILHYAHLCALAGGIDSFLIGSEMRALTQIMGPSHRFPAVEALIALAADVRAILGPDVKLSYAADWSEYFGYHPGNGDVHFHLDPLWADGNIDFIGIDNYMPLSDWRDGEDHLDARFERIDNHAYLYTNVCGGEGYDWYYAAPEHREAQIRTKIEDGAHGEHWIWRYKDLRGWWSNAHHARIGGVRQGQPTAWQPRSKPFWFTELGCAALDKGTNQPNKFLDVLSSESRLPHYSNGRRDDAMQTAYLRAMRSYWGNQTNNPTGSYGGAMVDVSRAHVWCWDARPFPAFPGRGDLWSDGPAWEKGHWLNGRAGAVRLADLVLDLCLEAGITAVNTNPLSGVVRGYALQGGESGRAALQTLMLAYGFDAVERDGELRFVMRDGHVDAVLSADDLAEAEGETGLALQRAPEPEIAGRVRLTHIEAGGDYAIATAESVMPEEGYNAASDSELSLALTRPEARAITARWLAESRVARDGLRFALPPSRRDLGPGDVVEIPGGPGQSRRWRIDRVERAGAVTVDAIRVEPSSYQPAESSDRGIAIRRYQPPLPVWPVFLDLPLIRGDEAPHAPHLAVTAQPWPGRVAAFSSVQEEGGYTLNRYLGVPAIMGHSQSPLARARPGLFDRGPALKLRLKSGRLGPASETALMAGANLMAIGDGTAANWELFQFAHAEPVPNEPGSWLVSMRLRGQAGSETLMPDIWPEGSVVVLLNGSVGQVNLPPAARGQRRYWRIGPAIRPYDDPSYRLRAPIFQGVGLRPYAPCHLRMNGRVVSWVRRSRLHGDDWSVREIALGEAQERYLIQLRRGARILYEAETSAPHYEFSQSDWQDASAGGDFILEVAQISDQFGPGAFARSMIYV